MWILAPKGHEDEGAYAVKDHAGEKVVLLQGSPGPRFFSPYHLLPQQILLGGAKEIERQAKGRNPASRGRAEEPQCRCGRQRFWRSPRQRAISFHR